MRSYTSSTLTLFLSLMILCNGSGASKTIKGQYEETYSPTVIGGKLWYLAKSQYSDGVNNLMKDHLIADGEEVPIDGEEARVDCLKSLGDKPAYFVTYRKSSAEYASYLQYGDKKYEGMSCPDTREDGMQLWDGKLLLLNDYKRSLVVDGKPYDRVSFIKMADDQPVYRKDRDGKHDLFYGQKKYSLDYFGDDFHNIADAAMVNNTLALGIFYPVFCKAGGSCPPGSGKIIYDQKEIKDPRYVSMEHPFEYRGALAYVGTTKKGESVIVSREREISSRHAAIVYPQVIEGKLAYFAFDENGYAWYYDNIKKSGRYGYIQGEHVEKIGNQFAFIASKDSAILKEVVVYGKREFGKGYDSVGSLSSYNGKIMYVGIKNNKRVIVIDGMTHQ